MNPSDKERAPILGRKEVADPKRALVKALDDVARAADQAPPFFREMLEEAEAAARESLATRPSPLPDDPKFNLADRATQVVWMQRHLRVCKRFVELLEQIPEGDTFEHWYRRYMAAAYGWMLED